jgi:RimJ/RimL family protein N-acetyltransferase
MSSDFTREDQLLWYQNLEKKENYYIWGIMCNNIPIGACGIKNVFKSRGECWCYIGEKSYWGLGIGKWILISIRQEAIKLGLAQLEIRVHIQNIKSINLHKMLGFIEEKFDGEVLNLYCNLNDIMVGDI